MRNLKKILALVLALVMSMSLMATANAAFADANDIDGTYDEAVQVLNALGVFEGRGGNNFEPKATITRAEVAAIIYRIVTGDTTKRQNDLYSDYNEFDDVPSTHWAAGYIGFCYNGEYIKGYNKTTFGPSDPVTGYQALAMILRAVGYDKNHEFEGSGWEIRTAQIANERQITKNLKDTTLRTPATREIVAEILFQAILVNKAQYTPAFSYQTWGTNSIGYDTFGLVGPVVGTDVWGRPATTWMLDRNNNKAADLAADKWLVDIAYKADASYTTRVDECDIANDLGLTTSAKIEAAFIDGETYGIKESAVTTDRTGSIEPLNTTSYVGAQGRITEVYDMGVAGYRIVEINTYLAQVAKVNPEKVDKNGHVSPASVDLNVWQSKSGSTTSYPTISYNYKTDEFVKGQYVLVTIAEPTQKGDKRLDDVRNIVTAVATEVAATGVLNGYTAATTKIGDVTYDDADKFVLGYDKTIANVGNKAYDVFVDEYGNIIGKVPSATNYLTIEAIRWVEGGTLFGGYATAQVVLANGERVEDVTVATVGGKVVTPVRDLGTPVNATVSDSIPENPNYYNHLTTYTVDADGKYHLGFNTAVAAGVPGICFGEGDTSEAENADIRKGLTTISWTANGNVNRVVANDNTVFLVKNLTTGLYETYVGKNNVPNMDDANICYITNAAGYATVVLVTNYTLPSNEFVAFVPAETTARQNTDWWYGIYNGKYAYDVYKAGESTPTTIYSNDANLFNFTPSAPQNGFYRIKVDANQVVVNKATDVSYIIDSDRTTSDTNKASGITGDTTMWDLTWVQEDVVGGSMLTGTPDFVWPNKDFNIDDAKFFMVTETTLPTADTITTVEELDILAAAGELLKDAAGDGTKVAVAYPNGTTKAAYVYIFAYDGQAAAGDKYEVSLIPNPYTVTVNSVNVIKPTAYVPTTAGTPADALAGAMANATQLSLSGLVADGNNKYTFNVAGMTANGVVGVYQNSSLVPTSITLTGSGVTTVTTTLAVGNYIVIADNTVTGIATFYAVYEIVA